MATNEERLDALEEARIQQQAASLTMLEIVKESDRKLSEVLGTVRSIQAQQIVADSRLNTIDNRLNAQRVQIDNLQLDMQRSFVQASQEQARIEGKVDAMGEKIAALQSGQVEINDKLDTVLALLTPRDIQQPE